MMDGMDNFPNSGSGITQENVHNDDPGPVPGFLLSRYLVYLSLGFKWIVTPLILLMAGCGFSSPSRLQEDYTSLITSLWLT